MKVLLDTHIFIWWNGDADLLSATAREVCEDPANTLILSLASIWEMQIKSQIGKLSLGQPLPEIVASQQQQNGLELLEISTRHIYALSELPSHHRDPFDRLLIAQASTEQMPLLTADSVFTQYEVDLLS